MLPHPVALEGVDAPARPPRAAAAIAALALAAHALERLSGWSLAHHGPLGERAARAIASAAASARLYPEHELFAPWQPWTSALIASGWWQLGAACAAVVVAGWALEAELGALAVAACALATAPIAAAGAVLVGGDAGLSGVACALLGMALARRPRARLRWGLSYYAVVEVGHVRLSSSPLASFAALYLGSELTRLAIERGPAPWGAWVAGGLAGAALGLLSRRLRPVG